MKNFEDSWSKAEDIFYWSYPKSICNFEMTKRNYLTHDWSSIADYEMCITCGVMSFCNGGKMYTSENSTCAERIMKAVML